MDARRRGSPSDVVRTIYGRRFDEAARASKARIWRIIVERSLQRWVRSTDTVLDVGCGFGEFLNHVRAARRKGVDLNPEARSYLGPDVEFHEWSAADPIAVADASVDLVFTSNFLEHLPDKHAVEHLVDDVRRVLRPSGHLVALGPNVRAIPGQYWDFWDHLVPISDRSLGELLETRGFEVTDSVAKFLPYTSRTSLPQTPWLVKLYLAVPLAWEVFGGQFLVRARKR
jgi:SAM-dependent methyltransferase